MAGLFGGLFGGGASTNPMMMGQFNPNALSPTDRLMLIGATLKDTGNALRGGDSSDVMGLQQLLAGRQMMQARNDFLSKLGQPQFADSPPVDLKLGGSAVDTSGPSLKISSQPGMFGGSSPTYTYQAPTKVADSQLSLDNPDLPALVAKAKNYYGIDLAPSIEALKASRPEMVRGDNGVFYNKYDSTLNGAIAPKVGEGQYAKYGPGWQFQGVAQDPGYLKGLGESEAVKTAAQEGAKAAFVFQNSKNQAAGAAEGAAPFTLTTQNVNGVPTTMTTAQALQLAGATPDVQSNGAAPSTATIDPKAFFKNFVLPHEGGLNPSDMNGAPTKYGINQRANPGVDVTKLSPDQAGGIFAEKYWAKSGAANLPPALGVVHADTYFINPQKAQQFLQASGGDPQKYLAMREQWMSGMVQNNPEAAKYAQAWAQRNADLAQLSGALAGGGFRIAPGGAPPTPGFHGVNPDDEKKVAAYMEDARNYEDLVQKGHQFQELNKQQATGPGFRPLNVPLPFMGHVDVNVPGALARQYQTGVPAAENLSMQMATGLRAPGQRLTQVEIMKNLGSVPSINNLPAQNDRIVQDYEQRATNKRAYANFMSDWLAKNGSLTGADEAWAQQQRQPRQAAQPAQKPPKIRVYNPKTGNLE